MALCDTLGDTLVCRVLVGLVHQCEVGFDTEVGDISVLTWRVRVVNPCHDALRELSYLKGELVEGFGIVYHHGWITFRYLLQPLKIFILALVVLVFVVVIAHVERRVCHDAILVTRRKFWHTIDAINIVNRV